MMMAIANICQLIGGIILAIGYMPQIRTTLKTKSVEDIDRAYYPSIFAGVLMFEIFAVTLYATTGEGIMLLITSSTTFVLVATMLTLCLKYRKKK